ncbi:5248_t:CDS:2 [Dentiscutata erythropus]|uniref:5248_t:CDS:1 n=1 Tax=Dentiscutata erythropus TaxID=1348616 RepID=A0A9N9GB08_9GLOM|nr:5248_t:CDS:2 [Dentiscutata erythropus]
MAVTMLIVRRKAKELGEALGIENAQFSRGWVVYFKNRHNLVKRVCTQVAQKFSEDMLLVVRDFLKKAREKTMNIEKKFIISFNETPIWFNIPCGSTLEFQDTRKVPIKTIESDKLRFTVVLGYTASEDKLPLAIIFKFKKKPRGQPNRFFKNQGVVFVDRHRSHIRDNVVRVLNNEGLDVLEIPGGTTSVLQPPNVLVNKPFKSGMRQRWEEWMEKGKKEFTAKGNRKKVSYELAIIENHMSDIDRDELLNEKSVCLEDKDNEEKNENNENIIN